jgi:uncharacterized protein (DUF983 family)
MQDLHPIRDIKMEFWHLFISNFTDELMIWNLVVSVLGYMLVFYIIVNKAFPNGSVWQFSAAWVGIYVAGSILGIAIKAALS